MAKTLSEDLRGRVPEDDVAHFVVAAVERVPLGHFAVPDRTGGKPQNHPRLMLALLVHCYADGILLVLPHQVCDLARRRGALCRRQPAPRPRHHRDLSPHQHGGD